MSAIDRFEARMELANSLLCVGLDPDLRLMPPQFRKRTHPLFAFNAYIIEATHQYVCAYKPNSAFYEAFGADGIDQLHQTCVYLHKHYPDIPIILDAKRGDIDSTNNGYVSYAYDYLGADAITLNPYLGQRALEPFLKRTDKVSIILCRTSNVGADEFQKTLYEAVAQHVSKDWNTANNCMLVVGATAPKELARVRKIIGEMTVLVPGVGAQGGDLETVLKHGLNKKKKGVILAISRAILYAGDASVISRSAKEYANATSLRS